MNTPQPVLSPAHFPRIINLPDGSLARVTRCDATDIAFDRVVALVTAPETYRTTVPAQAVPAIAGFDPATAAAWPSDAALAEAIANPPDAPATVPASVTRRQLKEQLIRMDRLHEVEATVSAIPGTEGRIARNWWAEAVEFRRDHPLVAAIGGTLGLTAAQIDALFVAAAQL